MGNKAQVRLHAAVRHVRDLERSRSFYATAFGLSEELSEQDAMTLVDEGGAHRLALRQRPNLGRASSTQSLVWVVATDPEFLDCCARLEEAGHRVERVSTRDGSNVAFVPDPDGYPNVLAVGTDLDDIPAAVFTY